MGEQGSQTVNTQHDLWSFVLLTTLISILSTSFAFPNFGDLQTRQEVEDVVNPPPAPGPPKFTGTKLVHDRAPLQYLQLLRLLAVKCGQLGWIRLILHMEKNERVHSEIRRMELA